MGGVSMRKLILVLVLVGIAVALGVFAGQASGQQQDYTQAIVKVWTDRGSGGTGTLVQAGPASDNSGRWTGHVVTCRHVTEGSRNVRLTFRDGTYTTGMVLIQHPSYDIAIIRCWLFPRRTRIVVMPIAPRCPPAGVNVIIYGYGGQYGIPTTSVRLMRFRSRLRYKPFGRGWRVQFRALAKSGDSGGPVVDEKGHLIGLVSGGELAGYGGPAVDSHGPYLIPILNLLGQANGQRNSKILEDPDSGEYLVAAPTYQTQMTVIRRPPPVLICRSGWTAQGYNPPHGTIGHR